MRPARPSRSVRVRHKTGATFGSAAQCTQVVAHVSPKRKDSERCLSLPSWLVASGAPRARSRPSAGSPTAIVRRSALVEALPPHRVCARRSPLLPAHTRLNSRAALLAELAVGIERRRLLRVQLAVERHQERAHDRAAQEAGRDARRARPERLGFGDGLARHDRAKLDVRALADHDPRVAVGPHDLDAAALVAGPLAHEVGRAALWREVEVDVRHVVARTPAFERPVIVPVVGAHHGQHVGRALGDEARAAVGHACQGVDRISRQRARGKAAP
mmetsp:Transcript_32539/g.95727  ORF Transcript_32539/g.95727 Transcript_32539/m.95727 type:complete len:273 (-) Transcript_32539:149-967(-)